jgi:Cdc6-like AAA superfamily ATPase
MDKENKGKGLVDALKQVVNTSGRQDLMARLKAQATAQDLDKRDQFEYGLLELAKQVDDPQKRQIVYETMASLNALWEPGKPETGMSETFWKLYKAGKYPEAQEVCSRLLAQGLDYIGSRDIGAGRLVNAAARHQDCLLHYSDRWLYFLDRDLEKIKEIAIPKNMRIIDLMFSRDKILETGSNSAVSEKFWLLVENSLGSRSIMAFDLANDQWQEQVIQVPEGCRTAGKLASFKEKESANVYLILKSPHSIFYYLPDRGWQEWYAADLHINCMESIQAGLWLGLDDGEVFILKKPGLPGVRDRLKVEADTVRGICHSERYAAVSGGHSLHVIDAGSLTVSRKFVTPAWNVLSCIIDNHLLVTLQANGFLVGREIEQAYTSWQLNLGAVYESVFSMGPRIYLANEAGEVALLETPNSLAMTRALEKQHIKMAEKPPEQDPHAPVRRLGEFLGRRDLLHEIKESGDAHFLVAGEPKAGKTSLLNVLPQVLSSSARCCYIDMSGLLDNTDNYREFESAFISRCLNQHMLKLKTAVYDRHQAFRPLVDGVRREKDFCVFCLDNFNIPDRHEKFLKEFRFFITELFIHRHVRLLVTCHVREKKKIWDFFKEIQRDASVKRNINCLHLHCFSEDEVKNHLRTKHQFTYKEIEEIYRYTGGFPHLLKFYDHWERQQNTIKSFSDAIAKNHFNRIFDCFRDLAPETRLFLTLCFHQGLVGKKIRYPQFYETFPLLRKILPEESLKAALRELRDYGQTFEVEEGNHDFSIHLRTQARLFFEAARHLATTNVLAALNRFSDVPGRESADQVVQGYSQLVGIDLKADPFTEQFEKGYRDEFYIRRLTQEGQQALGMPLETFLIIPLKPWDQGKIRRDFVSLYTSIQERLKRPITTGDNDIVGFRCYILLFAFHGQDFSDIKSGIKELERVSIIDAHKMKEIILDPDPRRRSSDYIFNQLNISERSPYTTAGAVQELFYGRELEIALIRGLPENIGIFGTRTIGKTSLLLKLNRDIQTHKNWKVYVVDCSRIDSEESLLQNLAEKMKIPHADIADMEKFRKYISRRAEKEKAQFLFLLDEVDRLVEYDIGHEERIFKTFNRMCTESLESGGFAARFILSGFNQMFEQMKDPESRLYNFMVFLPLRPLDEKSALALVTKPMKDIHVRWQDEEKDANYLVDSCSGHPLLLQAACHSLLSILDDKKENKDMVERKDIDSAFNSELFQQLCMRFYHSVQSPKTLAKKGKWLKLKKTGEKPPFQNDENRDALLTDIHRIAILSALLILFAGERGQDKGRDHFSLTELHNALKQYGIEVSPDEMRRILDNLCLLGILRLIDEPHLIVSKELQRKEDVQQHLHQVGEKKRGEGLDSGKVQLGLPDTYADRDTSTLKFTYKFAIKIFPRLLMANFDGIDKCKEELQKLVEKQDWREWLGSS